MDKLTKIDLSQSELFLWQSARLLERLRFEHLFRGGPREPVLAVLRGYQRADGGFGGAIEPDFRGPISQPLSVDTAFRVLDELERPERSIIDPALEYLTRITGADGGVPNVVLGTELYPRAPWWQPAVGFPGCLLPTASLAGLLYKWGVDHAWLERASAFSWSALDAVIERAKRARDRERIEVAYHARAGLVFLDHTPERARAERVAAELGRVLQAVELIAHDPTAPGEAHPLEFAPTPQSLARRWFDDETIARQLDGLLRSRAADGGWPVPWPIWLPLTEYEWRGILTVERLKTIRAYARLDDA